jgi:hypothetical protein
MKKWLAALIVILILATGSIYIFIPSRITIGKRIALRCNANSAIRFLGEPGNWVTWWPGGAVYAPGSNPATPSFAYKGMSFRPEGPFSRILTVAIQGKDSDIVSHILVLRTPSTDSANIQWTGELAAGTDPITRIKRYQYAKEVYENMGELLSGLRTVLEKKENIYGLDIRKGSTKDSFLVATRSLFTAYPTTPEIYALLKKVKDFISTENVRETGFPMLNVTDQAKGQFMVQVAIPVNKEVKKKGDLYSRKMVDGKYLVSEVKGGTAAVDGALDRIKQYIDDYQITTMAIPFQLLITDRSLEKDSTRWVTWVYYPVM